jgi:carboxypeptidase C (cathepsin A)
LLGYFMKVATALVGIA